MKKVRILLICSALFAIALFLVGSMNIPIKAADVSGITTLEIINISEPVQVKVDNNGYYVDKVCDFHCENTPLENPQKTSLPNETPKGNQWITANDLNDPYNVVTSFAIDLSQFNPNSNLKYYITNQDLQNEYHPIVIDEDHMVLSIIGTYHPSTKTYSYGDDYGIMTLAFIGDQMDFVGIDDSNFTQTNNESFNVKFTFAAYVPENDPAIGKTTASTPNTEYYLNMQISLNGEISFNEPVQETPISNDIARVIPIMLVLLIIVGIAMGGYAIYRRNQKK